jgi:hypothetical protein
MSREAVASRLGVGVNTVGQMTSKARRAVAEGHDLSRPYLWLPLPGADECWDRQAIEDYVADAPARRERKRSRTRGPAARVVDINDVPHMALQVEHRLTREQLRWALCAWQAHHKAVPLPSNRASLLAVVRHSLETWGTANSKTQPPAVTPEVAAALQILWPKEA